MKTLVIALIVTAAMAHSMNNDSRHKYDEKLKKCKAKALADPLHFCFGSHALVQHAIPCLEHATDHQVQAIYKTFGASSKTGLNSKDVKNLMHGITKSIPHFKENGGDKHMMNLAKSKEFGYGDKGMKPWTSDKFKSFL
jgi:hypothetical protein